MFKPIEFEILPNFVLYHTINQQMEYTGIDSLESCIDKKHFKNYPHTVKYQYNDRGYRDQAWPTTITELENSVWCFGDSFTVGLSAPVEHTWPWLLGQQMNKRTINVSMDGASNNWIARKVKDLVTTISPKTIVLHWSYLHRREKTQTESTADVIAGFDAEWKRFYNTIRDPSWPVCESYRDFGSLPERIQTEILNDHYNPLMHRWFNPQGQNMEIIPDESLRAFCSSEPSDDETDDVNNLIQCIDLVEKTKSKNTRIIHSFIPYFFGVPRSSSTFMSVFQQLNNMKVEYVPSFHQLDMARDGHHYDIKTAEFLVQQLIDILD
jgi:hypothetical protein